MRKDLFICLLTLVMGCWTCLKAQNPSVNPKAVFDTADGATEETEYSGSAPIAAHFTANVSDLGNYSAVYEWKIYTSGNEASPIVDRFEENMDYTFTKSGTFYVQLYVTFVAGTDTIVFPEEGEASPFTVSISESKLEVPNAFSPNGDGINDVFKVKDTYTSIVSFKATIFNRWGQKLYEWSDLAGGWDGKFHGSTVKDGVYFVVIQAKGADGKKYNIKRDVNVLTGFSEKSSSSSTDN
jgi:gliding motility-associated-like protein